MLKEIDWIDDHDIVEEKEMVEKTYSISLHFPTEKIPFNHFCRNLEIIDNKMLKFTFRDRKYIVPFNSVSYISIEEEN